MLHIILEYLKCPVSHTALRFADADILFRFNEMQRLGQLYFLDGTKVLFPIENALQNEDASLLYHIKNDIAILLPTLAMPKDLEHWQKRALSLETEVIKQFYDEIGWTKSDENVFEDAQQFEDLRPIMKDYIHKCHLRVNEYLPLSGKFLLDAASGPIQYDEYLTYSEHYDYRICVDISFSALTEARKKLKDKGIYILCDLVDLPFKDDSIDTFVSLHTIYHIATELQLKAFAELHRVLKNNSQGIVVYSWGNASGLMLFFKPRTLIKSIIGVFSKPKEAKIDTEAIKKAGFFFSAHSLSWFDNILKKEFDVDIAVWRTLNVAVGKRIIKNYLGGSLVVRILFFLENKFPRFFGRYGQYPMIILKKNKNN